MKREERGSGEGRSRDAGRDSHFQGKMSQGREGAMENERRDGEEEMTKEEKIHSSG